MDICKNKNIVVYYNFFIKIDKCIGIVLKGKREIRCVEIEGNIN